MHRRSDINAPLKVKENESRYAEEKEEACFPDLSKDQKICKVTKSKVIKASKKENLSDVNQAQLQKCTPKYTKGLEKESYHNKEDVVNCQFTECFSDTVKGDMAGEPTLPLNSKENFSRSRPVSLGNECYLTPNRDKAEEKPDCGISEKQRKTPVDFATVTIAEFGITQESFTKRSIGNSPASLKFRRRSTIGVRGSPENNTLIQYLAQQRSNRQKEAFTQQVSTFRRENVRLLKDKIDAFQTSFKSVQEAEEKTGFSGLSQVDDASQEAGSSQDKVPFTKEQNLDQWNEKFISDNSGAEENLRQNLTNSTKSDTKICTILSSCQDVTVTEPAAAVSKEWVYEEHSPTELLESVLIRDILETGRDFSPDHITKDVRSNVTSDLTRKKVSFAEELSLEIFDESKPPVTPPITPLQMGNTSLKEHTQSGSHLRSVLKKTPMKQLMDSMKEYSNDAVDRGGGESLAVSNCVKIFEALQTEKTEKHSSEKPKKKRVTFGEVLSPEIFDETLPANTPLRKGATPVRHPGLQSNSPFARSGLIEEPLCQPNFDCDDECVNPLQELVEGPVVAEDLLPVENAEAETDKSDMIKTRSSTKKKCSTISEETDFSISRATNAEDTNKPRKNKFQRQKNITTSAAKKTQKIKRTGYGKRRKKKVKKSLYGEREMASKKPLLSPIPEIPEVFSSTSSPNSPKANALFSGNVVFSNIKSRNARKDIQQKPVVERMRGKNICAVHTYSNSKDLDVVEASSPSDTMFQVSDGDLKSVSGIHCKFSNVVPDADCGFHRSDDFQQGKETACVKEAKESGSLIENEKLQGNLLNKAEQLTGLEYLEQQDASTHESAKRTQCTEKDSVRGSPLRRRRRSSSAIYFPPVENLEITGNDLPVCSFNVEEVLSVPQLKNDSLEPFGRKIDTSGKKRVRRSMRLYKDAEIEGLAWIQVHNDIQKNPPLLASACKTRRRVSTSVLTQSENIHNREQNLLQFAAPGKENNDTVNLADGHCKRWRRKSLCVSTPQETRPCSQTQKRRITNSVCRKDRSNQKRYEEVEMPLEYN
ncbi:PREDICTED: cell division cycle-associated protein 2-like [Cariama cristata]|uniref:cell division cycle-associated protein 2-like n=1 Tax=Cariama cristata TaxID=54380 RepID=UPI00051FF6B8|nr:PREDICTED: cell division cycle-associated protein 2-like [Cariama cristata]